MTELLLRNITKRYDDSTTAVKNVNLEIHDGEFVILVGPSGCGKSTTLRMIAGLEDISEGDLIMDGQRMNDVEPQDRNIAMVFQNYALYPHMSVYQNIAYSLKIHGVKKDEIDRRVHEAARSLGLEELLDRKPGQLSGGQKQRVAMGRAIIRNPKVFLMDEPLSNLDAKLRAQMRVEIANLYHKLKTTFIYVTHDQVEAMTLGTKIVVMNKGEVQQIDSPYNLFHYPANKFVAGFIGTPTMNFLEGTAVKKDNGYELQMPDGIIRLDEIRSKALEDGNYNGKKVTVGIRPDYVSPVENAAEATLKGTLSVHEMLGYNAVLYVDTPDGRIVASVPETDNYLPGMPILLKLDADHVHIFDVDTGITICN